MCEQPVVLIAASGLAREVISAVRTVDTLLIVAILDDNVELHGTDVGGVRVAGSVGSADQFADAKFVVCAGSGGTRQRIVTRMSGLNIGTDRFATVIHPSAQISSNSVIGPGSIVLAGVTLTSDVHVGEHVVLMPHVVLTHDNQIAEFATLSAAVVLGGSVSVGVAAYLGMNAAVRQNLRVGAESTLGMGSVLLQDLPDGETWIGVPASRIGGPGDISSLGQK